LYENQYMFGKAFLVFPFDGVTNYGKLYFPAGKWYNLYNGQVQQGNQKVAIDLGISKLPVYVKESSIIPMQSQIQTTGKTNRYPVRACIQRRCKQQVCLLRR
jgi:alpha-glucosidase